MKNSWLVLVLVTPMFLIPSCAGTGEQTDAPQAATISATSTPENAESIITQLERDWAAAIVGKDTATLERLLADDFTGTSANGQRYSKAEAIDDVKAGRYVAESMDLSRITVRVYGETAVVTLDQTEKSQFKGEDCSGRYAFTDVWVKRQGEWRAVAAHGSRGSALL